MSEPGKTIQFYCWHDASMRFWAREGEAWERVFYELRTSPQQRRKRGLNLKDNIRWLNEQIEKNREPKP